MKILKQNGTSGKILRAQGSGKVLKQNYNYGSSGKFRAGIKLNVKLPDAGLAVDEGFSFTTYLKNVKDITTAKTGYISFDDQNSKAISLSIQEDVASGQYNLYWKNTPFSHSHNNNLIFCAFKGLTAYVNQSSISMSSLEVPTILKRIIVGTSSYYSSTIGNVDNYSNLQIHELTIYSRVISDNELNHKYSNGLGNDDLNSSGIYAKYYFNNAAILDFSDAQDGSDMRVGVEDASGNHNHGEIIELPAGTIQEQLDYANLNVINSW